MAERRPNEDRIENIDLAKIQLTTAFLTTIGAVLLSVGAGAALGIIPTLPEKFRNEIPLNEIQLVNAILQYSNYLAISGFILLLGAYFSGQARMNRMRRRLVAEDNTLRAGTTGFRHLHHLQWWYRFEELR